MHFANGSRVDLSGRSSAFDGVPVSTSGGALAINAPAGSVAVDAGATLDVSAPAAGGQAGRVAIFAPTGTVLLAGALRATAASGQSGGSLVVDSGAALDLAALAANLSAVPNNFSGSLDVRNRYGDQQLAGGAALTSGHIAISTDTGSLTIAGGLDASGASGTTIALAGGSGLNVEPGAQVTAHSTGPVGGLVQLASGNLQIQANGMLAGSNGPVRFDGGSIDTTAASGGTNGTLLVRAQRNGTGTDVLIGGNGQTTVRGTVDVEVEAVKQYVASTVNTTLISQINADNSTLGGSGGANTAQLLSRVGSLLGQPSAALQLRAGVEVDSVGDMTVVGNSTAGGWNLTQFSANGRPIAQPTGAPMNLTLRAQGTLNVAASISDGFVPSGAVPTTSAAAGRIVPGAVVATIGGAFAQSARIRLVGGADGNAADVMKTVASASTGDVNIGAAGKHVLVRGTTGDIAIAAGRDGRHAQSPSCGLHHRNAVQRPRWLRWQQPVRVRLPSRRNGEAVTIPRGRRQCFGGGRSRHCRRLFEHRVTSVCQRMELACTRPGQRQRTAVVVEPVRPVPAGFRNLWRRQRHRHRETRCERRRVLGGKQRLREARCERQPDRRKAVRSGDLDVEAGRDIIGGFVLAGGTTGSVRAGRNLVAGADGFGLQLLYGTRRSESTRKTTSISASPRLSDWSLPPRST